MMRSLFSGVSALQNHQVKMDVIGNNIANVNTVGYKAGMVNFEEALSQTLKGASGSGAQRGGTNPQQVGLGMTIASIDTIHTQGNLQNTGGDTHLAIEGDGMFVLKDGQKQYYTRAGLFGVDENGNLVNPNGLNAMGWMAVDGVMNKGAGELQPLQISKDLSIPPKATEGIWIGGNLDSTTNGSLLYGPNPMTISDESGNTARLFVDLTPTGSFNEWNFEASVTGGTLEDRDGTAMGSINGTIRLDATGNLVELSVSTDAQPSGVVVTDGLLMNVLADGGTNPMEIGFDDALAGGAFTSTTSTGVMTTVSSCQFEPAASRLVPIEVYDSEGNTHDLMVRFEKADDNQWHWTAEGPLNVSGSGDVIFASDGRLSTVSPSSQISFSPPGTDPVTIQPNFMGLTQFAIETSAEIMAQDGLPPGEIETFSISENGDIVGRFSNGQNSILGRVAVATFRNPNGLIRTGESLFAQSTNSGEARIDDPGVGSRGVLSPRTLEMSNVDLSQEFTDMIVTQRGYQANSRVITTADQLLEELVNLKR